MGRRFDFRAGSDGTGSALIPVADGEFFCNDIDPVYERGQCCLAFYNLVNGQPVLVTPTGGTAQFRASCIRDQFLTDSDNSTIQATAVIAGDATYTPSVFNGPSIRAKVTLDGITGATHVMAHYWATE